MNVFVHASIEPESFDIVITEAMVYGISVIAAVSGASKEIINDGCNGYLINPEKTDTLVKMVSGTH